MICKGIERLKGSPPTQKLPITIQILLQIYNQLDKTISLNKTMWAACLVAFFTFARKSSILVKSLVFDCNKSLCVRDLAFEDFGLVLTFRHTKTIQVCDRVLEVPLHYINDSPLCPVRAVKDMMSAFEDAPSTTPLFSFKKNGGVVPLTQQTFSKCLQTVLKACGLPFDKLSGHSFRRGGASFAFSVGVPVSIIKLQGDWKSDSYERYIRVPLNSKVKLAKLLALSV